MFSQQSRPLPLLLPLLRACLLVRCLPTPLLRGLASSM
jgi:hypothetical protein